MLMGTEALIHPKAIVVPLAAQYGARHITHKEIHMIKSVFPSGRVVNDLRHVNGKLVRLSEEAIARLAQEFPTINYFFVEEQHENVQIGA
jgi:hypothetical protein